PVAGACRYRAPYGNCHFQRSIVRCSVRSLSRVYSFFETSWIDDTTRVMRMNFKAMATGIAIMLVIAVIGIATELRGPRVDAGMRIGVDDDRQLALGRKLYASHCAACHGAQLEGQPNWRERRADGRLPAPPHDESGHTWHHPDAQLFDLTRNGLVPGRTAPEGYESDMPAYAGILTDEEIIAILAYIKSTWPPEIQELQRQVNENALQGGAR